MVILRINRQNSWHPLGDEQKSLWWNSTSIICPIQRMDVLNLMMRILMISLKGLKQARNAPWWYMDLDQNQAAGSCMTGLKTGYLIFFMVKQFFFFCSIMCSANAIFWLCSLMHLKIALESMQMHLFRLGFMRNQQTPQLLHR